MTDEALARARALLDGARSRGALRRLGAELDRDPELKAAVLAEGRRRGVELPDAAVAWPGKRLARLARGREADARTRTNPIARDEAFTCVHCSADVPPHGRTARDHCPRCLHGLHVDVVPGDRAADCGGVLVPVGVERRGAAYVLAFTCASCGAQRANRALLDGADPDDWERIVALAASP